MTPTNCEEALALLIRFGCLYIRKERNLGRCYNEYKHIFYVRAYDWKHERTRAMMQTGLDHFKVNDQGGTSVSESDVKFEDFDWHRVELTYTVDSSD